MWSYNIDGERGIVAQLNAHFFTGMAVVILSHGNHYLNWTTPGHVPNPKQYFPYGIVLSFQSNPNNVRPVTKVAVNSCINSDEWCPHF